MRPPGSFFIATESQEQDWETAAHGREEHGEPGGGSAGEGLAGITKAAQTAT